ncbi:MAG: tetratricopeptide repeat protein [Treponema sp.]|jgi:tetratricopeptide (TPR) repeat protein|nr:tetratricopeptide repeat protein [Treponema sp.]
MKGKLLPGGLFLLLFAFFCGTGPEAQSPSGAASWYERGRAAMLEEDWYTAAEAFMECLNLNPAHAEGTIALAECYYELEEFDEALVWVRKARLLARGDMSAANLEVSTLIALGRLDAAQSLVRDILSREPYNREALFASGEMEVARGQNAEAALRFREAVRRYPDDRRLLISLALVLGSLGDGENARSYIERALEQHPEDYRVYYYAAYLDAQAGRNREALRYAEETLRWRPDYAPALSLLASLRYRAGQYEETIRLADTLIGRNREDISAWYLKGIAHVRMGRGADGIRIFSEALSVNGEDEFIRANLEDILISSTPIEDPQRQRWANWHFARGRDYRSRNLSGEALFEYRRGLRLNPYARDRRDYAEILRLQGYPSRYLEELRFLQELGQADRTLNDAVEAYGALLSNTLPRRWQIDPVEAARPHWNVAVFSTASPFGFFHPDGGLTAAALIREFLSHDRNMIPMALEPRQPSFSQAYRIAREAGADYFLMVSVVENDRDISVKGELFVGRTGSPAASFSAHRTGPDRLRNAVRGLVEQLAASLPIRGELILRRQAQGLIDKGRVDGLKPEQSFDVVKKGQVRVLNEGIGLAYSPEDVVGTFTITEADEEVAAGTLARNGFFDRIEPGDELILQDKTKEPPREESAANPELRSLLRRLR